jgi:dTDP-4-dehydrorhamnose reductase
LTKQASRWLVTGAGGMLGRELVGLLAASGEPVTGAARADLDVADVGAVRAALLRYRPEVVVNCAAWTRFDDAELNEPAAFGVNATAVRQLALGCAEVNAQLVHISSDYVFDGLGCRPYAENAPCFPRSAYGRTKLAGERAALTLLPGSAYVVRTAWLYAQHGPSFVRTMIRLARGTEPVDVVDDQCGQPTYTQDVAGQIIALVRSAAPPGIYHATSSGEVTRYGLAQEIFRLIGADVTRVRPTTSARFAGAGERPAYSALGHDAWARVGLPEIGHWSTRLRRAFPALLASEQGMRI